MVVALIVPPAMSRISIMKGRMNVNVVRACGTPEPPRGRSRNRAIRLPRETRVVQVASPHAGDQHGGRIGVTMERIMSYLEDIVRDLNSLDKKRLHLWSILCSHGQFLVTYRRALTMASTSFRSKGVK
eukprot:3304333-Pyramimonas_sp.AAC.1